MIVLKKLIVGGIFLGVTALGVTISGNAQEPKWTIICYMKKGEKLGRKLGPAELSNFTTKRDGIEACAQKYPSQCKDSQCTYRTTVIYFQ